MFLLTEPSYVSVSGAQSCFCQRSPVMLLLAEPCHVSVSGA